LENKKYSGVLCHPTSFPSPYGIGDLGKGAKQFIDFLESAGQKLWQILPLTPTSFGDSPYQSFSCFAGNYLLISPEILKKDGCLSNADSESDLANHFDDRKIDYGRVIEFKNILFKKAFKNHDKKDSKYLKFCADNDFWLSDYALFMSLKNYFIDKRKNEINSKEFLEFENKYKNALGENAVKDYYYGAVWATWDNGLKNRDKKELEKYADILKEDIDYHKFLQFHFFKQWNEIKTYANDKNIRIIGDIPIFVAYDSCDVWVNKNIFALDIDGFPKTVAGVPPDYFSATGQLWGNPLYDWAKNQESDFKWWIKRIESSLAIMDILRIDHFRGFDTFWEIQFGAKDAVGGKWVNAPGKTFFDALKSKLGKLPIIAEDLGETSFGTEALRKYLDFPGMKILQFAFDGESNLYLPNNYTDSNTVVYTGTHDNDTTLAWYEKSSEQTKDFLRRYLNVSGDDICWDMIRLCFSSIARYALVPIQDIMRLDSYDRMNTPGTPAGNWQFRYTEDMLKPKYAEGLKYFSTMFNRNPNTQGGDN